MMNVAQRVHDYVVESCAEAPALISMAVHSVAETTRRRNVRRGAQIFDHGSPFAPAYTVASGEVLILREGRLIDMVEAGELLDPRIWDGATAIARTDCTLAPQ